VVLRRVYRHGDTPGHRSTKSHPAIAGPGNMRDLHHGGYSPRKVDPLAAEILEHQLAVSPPYLREPHWRPALWAWARTEARVQLVTEWLAQRAPDGVGDLDDKRTTAAHNLLHRLEAHATQLRGRLGLDPLSAARLGRDVAASNVDVAQLMSQLAALEVHGITIQRDGEEMSDGGSVDAG
jgi:hypothetical protein